MSSIVTSHATRQASAVIHAWPGGRIVAAPRPSQPTSPVDDARTELTNAMHSAMAGRAALVPSVSYGSDGRGPLCCIISANHAVTEALEHLSAIVAFRDALQHSTCPHVARLRAAMASGYAQLHAEDLAKARGLI